MLLIDIDSTSRLRIGPRELGEGQGDLWGFLRRHAARWSRRSLWVRRSRRFPVFDLAAAAYLIAPSLVTLGETSAYLHSNLWLEFGRGGRPIRIIRDLDPAAIWKIFADLLSKPVPPHGNGRRTIRL